MDRNAKHNVCYLSTTEQSSDEGYNLPRKKQKHLKPLPLSVPSADRLCAQDLISKKHTNSEHEAAKALVTLSTDVCDSSALSSENDTDTDTSTGKSVPTGTTSTDSVVSGMPSSSMSSSKDTDHVSGSESDIPHSRTASSDRSVSSGSVNKNRDVSTDGEVSESHLPLAKLKDKLKKEEVIPPCKKQTMVFKTSKIIGIKWKYRRERKFLCDACNFTDSSQGGLNAHYLDNHGKLCCSTCGKKCAMLSGYRMHLYNHSEHAKKYPCEDCDKQFPFPSQLKTYRKVHLTTKEHECQQCFKRYKNSGELTKHLAVHSKKTWKCTKCKYTCKDPRNLKAHRHTHGDSTRYICEKCKRGFNHYQQLKRHQIKDECV